MFEVRVERDFDFRSTEYELLFERSRATAFQHPIWLHQLYRILAPASGAEPLIIVARRADGAPAMVLPLVRRRTRGLRVIEFADFGVSDYACPVCSDRDFDALTRDTKALRALRALLNPFDLLRIRKVPDGSQPVEMLFGNARRTPLSVSAHAADLFAPYPDWRAQSISRSTRKDLDKKRRRMGRKGALRLERVDAPSALVSLLGELQIHRGRRFPDDLLSRADYFDFYREVSRAGAAVGFARGYNLLLDNVSLGGLWGLSHKGRFLVLITGIDYEAHLHESIGALAFEDLAQDCIAAEDAVLDFTIGDESYKRQFGARPTPMWTIKCTGSGLGALADHVAARVRRPGLAAHPTGVAAAE